MKRGLTQITLESYRDFWINYNFMQLCKNQVKQHVSWGFHANAIEEFFSMLCEDAAFNKIYLVKQSSYTRRVEFWKGIVLQF
jgi:hypothetical protein